MPFWWKKTDNSRLNELEEGFETLKKHLRAMSADMDTLWDKVNRTLGRISKRHAIVEKATAEEEEAQEASADADGLPPLDAGLSPRQRQLNAAIIASRRRM